ncbi:ComEA family DNA-binding protein [Listeria sp. FSL L7-0091]|uniref:ComEA family DNA-binding protein n=1 Tax=Listeria farberi TaxID=2713500 RepID=A0A7X0ZGJ1_9LIST|nr:helix-hairpin-helix domain-containing protein [Listeria farberi]MBC1374118.1 ComEA family DNA-binding protein [Listeria farberi]MBC1381230.1 ComEA family DNA-binding protein [Listeria farberi]MBC2260762.1 ComEA family DNA-binding protein [Listeria farberi]MBC2267438.1 ComEA family DNA-binding protein [Listeria farberi]MBC2286899.1 ComEA family DNA-binding protein [Listeria farberi]
MVELMKKYKNYILIGIAILCAGLVYIWIPDGKTDAVTAKPTATKEEKPEKEEVKLSNYVYVDIKGAIQTPGVYKLPFDARVQDVVKIAGGLTEEADSSKLNLAEKLKDEMSIYVYKKGEEGPALQESNIEETTGVSQKININSATKADLQQVPGIGESKATAIMEYREKEGLFQTIEDLKNVSGIGEKTVEKLKEYLDVN